MGGSSKSTVTNNTTTNNLQASLQGTQGLALFGDGNVVTDGGAIEAMRQTADTAAKLAGDNVLAIAALTEKLARAQQDTGERQFRDALGFMERSGSAALEFAAMSSQPDAATAKSMTKYITFAAVGVAALWALRGMK